jgi:hypothetical protein
MRIGYSHWGFIGPGVTDTPDGGRSWRATVLDTLAAAGHQLVLLQPNRDLLEAGHDLRGRYRWDAGLPEIDVLFLEWRWPLPGRNTTACGSPGHTCDLHRQQTLLAHYTSRGTRTLIWDLDQELAPDDPLRADPAVTVLEPALRPSPGARTLLTPIDDAALERADPEQLAAGRRHHPLVYVGNQYHRDAMFSRHFAPAALLHPHRVAGKWTETGAWPHVNFTGRVAFTEGQELQRQAVTTMLLLPEHYAAAAHMTQRLPEAVLVGALPLAPAEIQEIGTFVPKDLHIEDGEYAARLITELVRGPAILRAALLERCLAKLDLFRASHFAAAVDEVLTAEL